MPKIVFAIFRYGSLCKSFIAAQDLSDTSRYCVNSAVFLYKVCSLLNPFVFQVNQIRPGRSKSSLPKKNLAFDT